MNDREWNMISNQVLQSIVEGLKGISRIDLCVSDVEGKILASTFDDAETREFAIIAFADSPADSQVVNGYQFFKVFDEQQLELILLVKGNNDDAYMVGRMAAFQLQNLLVAYKERYDKDNFIKNLLLDNLLLVDIYNRAKKLHIETAVRRVVFIIETKNERDNNALETVRGLFASNKSRDFVTAVDEKNIIMVKELKMSDGYEEMEQVARTVLDMLNTGKSSACPSRRKTGSGSGAPCIFTNGGRCEEGLRGDRGLRRRITLWGEGFARSHQERISTE